jgi:hypothetical protein
MRRVLVVLWLVAGVCLLRVSASWGLGGCTYGGSGPLVTSNGAGEVLMAWTEVRSGAPEYEEGKVCSSAVTPVAVGSPAKGFDYLGPVSGPGEMSYPLGIAMDEAGDGWVIGDHTASIAGATRYALNFEPVSVWVAYRPPGQPFRPVIELPSAPKQVIEQAPKVAENKNGVTLFAWGTNQGAYLAWGDPEGHISKPQYYGHHLYVSAIGVDEHGNALIIGYYGNPRSEVAYSIVDMTGPAYGTLSHPHTIARQPRPVTHRAPVEFNKPIAVIAPSGCAVIVWNTFRAISLTKPIEQAKIITRNAAGRYTRPHTTNNELLEEAGKRREVPLVIDRDGRALFLAERDVRAWELPISSEGRLGRSRQLPSGAEPSLTDNESGETVIGIAQEASMLFLFGNTTGSRPRSLRIAASKQLSSEPAVTINDHGEAVAVWIEKPKENITVVKASAITPGAQPVQIARGELTP